MKLFPAIASLCLVTLVATAATPPMLELSVMSFNLRFASDTPPHAWPERRPIMRQLIEREAPDLIGTQEGLYSQLRDLAADLPAYDWVGLGRDGGSRGEFMAIFYRRDRFEPLAYDHFWLSDTPAVIGSKTWGNHYARMVTWVRLRDRQTHRILELWNTHLDHETEAARQKSASLLRERIAAVPDDVPLVLTGDFNCLATQCTTYATLTRDAGLTDTWLAAAKRKNEDLNTFHGYAAPKHAGERIDWILARRPIAVTQAAIDTYDKDGHMPSDHFPVTATLRY